MEFEQILKLIDAVSASGLSGLELEENGMRLRLAAGNSGAFFQAPPMAAAEAAPVKAAEGAPEASEASEPETAAKGREEAGELVKAPLVGTFYAAPAEDAEAFVHPGDRVQKGQVLGIIEAMKLMNEIECEYDGIVDAVLVENEQVVEYGQPLFRIRREA